MKFEPAFYIAARLLLGRGFFRGRRPKAEKSDRAEKPDRARPAAAAPPKSRKLSLSSGGMAGAILGIGISLVPLVLVLVVSDGMIQGITNRYMETKTYHLQAAVPEGLGAEESRRGMEAIAALPGVKAVYSEKNGSGVAVSPRGSGAVLIRVVAPEFFSDPGARSFLQLAAGRAAPEGKREIVLGSALAAMLQVSPGDSITLITPAKNAQARASDSAFGGDFSAYSPKLSFFKVAGVVSAGYRDLDILWAFVSPEAGEGLLSPASAYAFFGIKTLDPYSNAIGGLKGEIAAALSRLYPDWFEPQLVRTWPEIERGLYKSFGTTKSTLLFIMGIALLVAAINLGSALSTFVAERAMDIAVLRSLGAGDAALCRIFVGAGLITGAAGTLGGLFCGLILAWNLNPLISGLEWLVNIVDAGLAFFRGQPSVPLKLLDPNYYLEKIPLVIDARQIALIAASSLVLSALASLMPSRRAARVSVQELIRKT